MPERGEPQVEREIRDFAVEQLERTRVRLERARRDLRSAEAAVARLSRLADRLEAAEAAWAERVSDAG